MPRFAAVLVRSHGNSRNRHEGRLSSSVLASKVRRRLTEWCRAPQTGPGGAYTVSPAWKMKFTALDRLRLDSR